MEREKEIPIEAFGITRSPLDDYRGTGRHAKMRDSKKEIRPRPAPKPTPTTSVKQTIKVLDIAGNEVEIFIS